MKIISDLVDSLADTSQSLASALLKAKVILTRLGRKDLADWVSAELDGYPDGATVPSYRIVQTTTKGTVVAGMAIWNDMVLPTMHLTPDQQKITNEQPIALPIAGIEASCEKPGGLMRVDLPVELCGLIDEKLAAGCRTQRIWKEFGANQLIGIVAATRSKLLTFLLDLDQSIGPDPSDEHAKEVAQSAGTDRSFNHAIFGDNTVIQFGNNNSQSVKIEIGLHDFESLASTLQKRDVSKEDIDSLKLAIDADNSSTDVQQKKLGPSVRGWMGTMLTKAVNASWNIELGVAGGLLTNALQSYYGF